MSSTKQNKLASVVLLSFVLTGGALMAQSEPGDFLTGDANVDGQLSLSDVLTIRRWLFGENDILSCEAAADFNENGAIEVIDPLLIFAELFFDVPLGHPSFPSELRIFFHDPNAVDGRPGDDRRPGVDSEPLSCEDDTVVIPPTTDDVIVLGDVQARPGTRAAIPVYVISDEPVDAIQLVIAYDPQLFRPAPFLSLFPSSQQNDENHRDAYRDTMFERCRLGDACDLALLQVEDYPHEGFFTVAFVPNLFYSGSEVPGDGVESVFNIVGRVLPDVAPGETISFDPVDGPSGEGFGPHRLRNELTYRGDARFVSTRPLVIPPHFNIIPDVSIFIRGDSDVDSQVTVNDPITTLTHLFLNPTLLLCLDAADGNDDGSLTVSDPIVVLRFLFLGNYILPAPYPLADLDPTEDELGCESSGF